MYKSFLKGELTVDGSKNASLIIMAATLLTDEECRIYNVPDLVDVRTMIKILEVLGKKIEFEGGSLRITTKKSTPYVAPYRLVRTMRASFSCLGPLLAKRKKAKVSLPGGCVIGVRPVDLHIKGLKELGAEIKIEKGYCWARADKLRGKRVFLGGPFGSSVLATANLLMAATLAEGETIIESSACEPEISNLAMFLKRMGAEISGEGTPLLKIRGKKFLGGAEIEVIPDRIEAGTFIAISLATQSPLILKKVNIHHLTSILEVAKSIGAKISGRGDILKVKPLSLKPTSITTLPYPGFPTDLQAQFMIPLILARGVSIVTEKVFPDRFMHVGELNRMGAHIKRAGPYAVIEGVKNIYGAEVMASDLRASAALVIAGLAASGKTEILRIYHLDRGYVRLEEKLKKVGAKIKRTKQ